MKRLFTIILILTCSVYGIEESTIYATFDFSSPEATTVSIGDFDLVPAYTLVFESKTGDIFEIEVIYDYGDDFEELFAVGTPLRIRFTGSIAPAIDKMKESINGMVLAGITEVTFESLDGKTRFSLEGMHSERSFLKKYGKKKLNSSNQAVDTTPVSAPR